MGADETIRNELKRRQLLAIDAALGTIARERPELAYDADAWIDELHRRYDVLKMCNRVACDYLLELDDRR